MDALTRRRTLRVSSAHIAKIAVDLTAEANSMAEHVGVTGSVISGARWATAQAQAQLSIRLIREELAALEAVIAGQPTSDVAAA